MGRNVLAIVAVAALLGAGAPDAARAADPRYPDWPCNQLKVPDISIAGVWAGPPIDDEPDLGLPFWAGVLPVNTSYGPPAPSPDLIEAAAELPEHLRGYRRPVTPATSGAGPGSDRR